MLWWYMARSRRGGKGEGMGVLYSYAAWVGGYLFASSQPCQGGPEEMLALPSLGCWQSWHHDQGWLCPVGNAEHEQGPKQETPAVRPRHELGVALQPHHIPSPPVIWGMRGWLWDMGGHKPSARHVGRSSSGESAPAARTVQCHFKAGSSSEAGDCLVGLNHIGTILERV